MMPAADSPSIQGMQTTVASGKRRQAQADETVGANLQKHPRKQNASRGRRFHVRQRQPGVQREEWDFDGETGKQSHEHEQLERHRHGVFCEARGQFRDGETS